MLGKGLRPGQDLKIEITDIDLAGREDPMRRGAMDVRIMDGRTDWPRMRLRYQLEQHGKVIASAARPCRYVVLAAHQPLFHQRRAAL
jgi:hypothetical protein